MKAKITKKIIPIVLIAIVALVILLNCFAVVSAGHTGVIVTFGKVNDNVLQLTPKGSFFADEVSECFYDPRFIPFSREHYCEGPLSPYVINEEMDAIEKGKR